MTLIPSSLFPPRRESVKAVWMPLYFEPMIGSGERLCVGIVAGNSDSFRIVPVVGVDRLSCLYGREGLDFIHLVLDQTFEFIESSLSSQKYREDFFLNSDLHNSLFFPFEGFFWGRARRGTGNTLEEVAQQGLMLCASLTEKLSDASENSEEAMTRTRLEDGIRSRVTSLYPNLESYFGLKRTLEYGARPVKFNFVGQNLAANFSHLDPTSVASTVDYSKSRLWDLINLRVKFGADSVYSEKRGHYEILLYIPPDQIKYTPRQIRDMNAARKTLELESRKHSIEVFAHDSLDQMSLHIIQTEMNPAGR